jgi:endonuclease-3 related protein
MDKASSPAALTAVYQRLLAAYEPQHWWPAKTPFEVMVGAILTQSAAWTNVEKAIRRLEKADCLNAAALRRIDEAKLSELIYSCGYFRAKAKKLKALAEFLKESCGDDLDKLFAVEIDELRRQLLAVHGVGPETADSIVLYAACKPSFVIDAYTRRMFSRLGLASGKESYDELKCLFEGNLPADVPLFNEYHALLVRHGKDICRKKPLCADCCLRGICKNPTI